MGIINFIMGTRIGRILGSIFAGAVLVLGVFLTGKRAQRGEDRVEDLEKFIETKKEIDDVETSPTRDAAVGRLRDNGWLR